MRIYALIGMIVYFFFGLKEKDDIFNRAISPTVKIVSKDKEISGTGVVFKSIKKDDNLYYNIILSCEHIIGKKVSVAEYKYQEKNYCNEEVGHPAAIIGKDETNDLSLILTITKTPLPVAKINTDHEYKLLEQVYTIGCGLSDTPRFAEGKINGLTPSKQKLDAIRTTVPIVPGDSGGGLFNKQNEVIGIANSIRKFPNGGVMHPVEGISTFKPINLVFKNLKKPETEFVFGKEDFPPIFCDYLWILDADFRN
jgi:S1-C subfamily serine protease